MAVVCRGLLSSAKQATASFGSKVMNWITSPFRTAAAAAADSEDDEDKEEENQPADGEEAANQEEQEESEKSEEATDKPDKVSETFKQSTCGYLAVLALYQLLGEWNRSCEMSFFWIIFFCKSGLIHVVSTLQLNNFRTL